MSFASALNIDQLTQSLQNKVTGNQIDYGGDTTIGDHISKKLTQNPQFDYLFMMEMPDVSVDKGNPTNSPFPLNANPNAGIGGARVATDEINHRVFSVNAPMTEFESNKNTDMGTFMYSAGHADIGTLNLVIDEMEDGATLAYLLEWQKKMKNADGTYNPPYAYKNDIKVIRLSASKLEASVHVYRAYFPTNIEAMAFSHDSNQILQYNVTFTGDSVEHQMIRPEQLKGFIGAQQNGIINNAIPDGTGLSITPTAAKNILDKIRTGGF